MSLADRKSQFLCTRTDLRELKSSEGSNGQATNSDLYHPVIVAVALKSGSVVPPSGGPCRHPTEWNPISGHRGSPIALSSESVPVTISPTPNRRRATAIPGAGPANLCPQRHRSEQDSTGHPRSTASGGSPVLFHHRRKADRRQHGRSLDEFPHRRGTASGRTLGPPPDLPEIATALFSPSRLKSSRRVPAIRPPSSCRQPVGAHGI